MMERLIILGTIILLSFTPLIFWGNLYFVGGDDSRLYYLFPYDYFRNFTLHLISNNSLGSIGFYFSQSYIAGFSLLIYFVKTLFFFWNSQLLFFGINLSLGFLFFYLFLGLFFYKESFGIKLVSSLFYIFSTFSIYTLWQSQLFSLYLISTFPFFCYIFTAAFLKKNISYIIIGSIVFSIFSNALFSVPWFLALLIAVVPIFIVIFFRNKSTFFLFGGILFALLLLINFYWLFHFIYSPYSSEDVRAEDLASQVNSKDFRNSSVAVVESVAERNSLVYPFFGLFHKNIQKDFGWQTWSIFSQWNLKFFFLNIIFLFPVVLALFFSQKLVAKDRKLYLAALASWLITLFFFTVKIGDWGIDVFIWLNNTIPGFVMFKNMYDKFGLAMAFSYAFLFAVSVKILFDNISSNRLKKYGLLLIFTVVLLNAKPFIFGDFYKIPIWTTDNTYSTISDFNEDFYALLGYLSSMDEASRFLWIPMNNANYVQISDKNLKNHYYSGVSPLQFLANTSDFNGRLSFPAAVGKEIFENIEKRDYESAVEYLQQFNVKYVIVNRDISEDLQESYLYGEKLYNAQGEEFQKMLLGEKIADFGDRYSLYKINDQFKNEKLYLTDDPYNFPEDFSSVQYTKDASYQYTIQIKRLKEKETLVFLDPYHKLWELYFTKDRKEFLTGSHDMVFDYANGWEIDPEYIKKKFPKDRYHENPDGSIDLELTLYFKPQSYFYLGLIISGTTLAACFGYLSWAGLRSWRRRGGKVDFQL